MYDTIIIGAGPSGIYAATLCGLHKLNALWIESSFEYGGTLNLYKQKMVYDMPGYSKILAGDLIEAFYEQYKEYQTDVPLKLNCKALDIKKVGAHFELTTHQGILLSKTILLANGGGMFEPRLLDVEGADVKTNIYYNVKDVHDFENQDLVVLGGGDSAVDWALTLSEVANSVTLIHRRDDFRAHEGSVEKIKDIGRVLTPYVPKALVGYDKVDYLTITNTKTGLDEDIKLDALFVFYGSVASKNGLDRWAIEKEGNLIKVDSSMQTSTKGIYAVGNGVTYMGKKKMIATALGETATAINAISVYLNPEKTMTYKH